MTVQCDQLGKRFKTLRGFVDALRDISLDIREGELFVILGPSGCGKSTLLNLIAGLEKPSHGEIRFDEMIVASTTRRIFRPPRERDVAMVFQTYALYPHLNVFENIAFPLRIAKSNDSDIHKAVTRISESLEIEALLDRKPAELSGGQRQRVAIARALVRKPKLFLLDEPLSNLDAQLRNRTRVELKQLQRRMGITTLYVTHDQTEAMTLGDRIALLKAGELVQAATPHEIYHQPRTPFVATFIGFPPMNLVRARVEEVSGELGAALAGTEFKLALDPMHRPQVGREIWLGIRPEHLRLASAPTTQTLAGTILTVEPLGRETVLHIRTVAGDFQTLTSQTDFQPEDRVHLEIDPKRLHVFEHDSHHVTGP
jgi:multiple sugar transport system ATP-binding protein